MATSLPDFIAENYMSGCGGVSIDRLADGRTRYHVNTPLDLHEIAAEVPPVLISRVSWWDRTYRGVWTSPAELATLTYCEGDLTLNVLPSTAAYSAEIDRMAAFYADC